VRPVHLALIGLVSFIVVLVAGAPVTLLTSRLPADISLEGAHGSLASGGADTLVVRGNVLGSVEWRWRPLALLGLRLGYHVRLAGPEVAAEGDIGAGPGGRVDLDRLNISAPLAVLAAAIGSPGLAAASAKLAARLGSVRLVRGWPVAVTGTLAVEDLRLAVAPQPLGSYLLTFPASGAPGPAGAIVASVRDVKAPLAVEARLTLASDRTYRFDGSLGQRPDTPPELGPALGMLGPADASGRRPFAVGGTL
jgi:Type II secretion system (T2SS), protein N